ncbi:uncharacterized protein [Enoplosus armatus]|uniref:uncharacterized protein n=1 Tax=Enoplosus armatus TaxID=215367 RepID=UPI0039934D15
MEPNFDDALLSTELEERHDHKGNSESDSPEINPQPEVQDNNGELAEEDQDANYFPMSDPVICTAGGPRGSTSAVIPEVDRKALMPPSILAIPPPLPPKSHQRSLAFERTLSQQLKSFNKENKPLNSLARSTSPVLSGVKGNNLCLDPVPGEVPDTHNSYACGILPKVEPKSPPQLPPRPPHKSPIKPPQHNNPKRAETDEGKQRRKQEAEWRKHTGQIEDKRNRQEQYPTDRNQKMVENEETSGIESLLVVVKRPRQILVLFTDKEKGGEEGEDREKADEDHSNIGLTTPAMTENSSLLAMGCSDLIPDQQPDMAATNRNCTSTVSAKPEGMIPPQHSPKPHPKCPPKPPIKPPQLFSAMRAGIEEEKERRKQEGEQWRDKDLVNKGRDESEGQGQDKGGKVNRDLSDTELTTPTVTEMPSQLEETGMKSTMNQEVVLPGGGNRFCLMPPCRNRPKPVITAENQTLHQESHHPRKQHQNKANEPCKVPARVNPSGTDSNTETLKWTENDKEIQMSRQGGQESEVISKLPSGRREGTEVVRTKLDPCQRGLQRLEDAAEIGDTALDGEAKQTSQKTSARGKVKKLAKMVVGRLKEGREEKRRNKVEEMHTDGEREEDIELTQDERRHGEGGGVEEEEEEEEEIDEDAVDQSPVTETLSHAELLERRIERRHATSESPFSSFKVCSPVRLVEELLWGDEWSQFLLRDPSPTPDPPPCQTHSGDSVNFRFNSSTEQDLALDVFEGDPAAPEEEPVYEDIDQSNIITEESQTREQREMSRAPVTAIPQILLESEASQMTLQEFLSRLFPEQAPGPKTFTTQWSLSSLRGLQAHT